MVGDDLAEKDDDVPNEWADAEQLFVGGNVGLERALLLEDVAILADEDNVLLDEVLVEEIGDVLDGLDVEVYVQLDLMK